MTEILRAIHLLVIQLLGVFILAVTFVLAAPSLLWILVMGRLFKFLVEGRNDDHRIP